jgi:hypothetical protein
MRSKTARVLLIALFVGATGCGHAPSFNLLGSYFPAWLVCFPIAILLTVLLRLVLRRLLIEDYFRPVFLSYFASWAFFMFALWLLFFS